MRKPVFTIKAREEAIMAAQEFLMKGGYDKGVSPPSCPWPLFTPEGKEWRATFDSIAPEPEGC